MGTPRKQVSPLTAAAIQATLLRLQSEAVPLARSLRKMHDPRAGNMDDVCSILDTLIATCRPKETAEEPAQEHPVEILLPARLSSKVTLTPYAESMIRAKDISQRLKWKGLKV